MRQLDDSRMMLLKAAQEMEKRGWCRKRLIDRHGHVCMVESVLIATGRDMTVAQPSLDLLDSYVRQRLGGGEYVSMISYYNDFICKNKEDALAAINAAAVHGL